MIEELQIIRRWIYYYFLPYSTHKPHITKIKYYP